LRAVDFDATTLAVAVCPSMTPLRRSPPAIASFGFSNLLPIVIAVLTAVAGCASSGYRELVPGAVLAVKPVYERVPQTQDTELRDSSGVLVGTQSTIIGYRDVYTGFSLNQGDEVIDEQDYYHLAKDRDGFDAVARARASGIRLNRIGFGVLIASLATAILVPQMFKYEDLNHAPAPVALAIGQAGIMMPLGIVLAMAGELRATRRVLPAQRALKAIGEPPASWVPHDRSEARMRMPVHPGDGRQIALESALGR